MRRNIILNTDSYKIYHWLGYPENTEYVYSYMESRGGYRPKTVVAGYQGLIREFLTTPITVQDIEEAAEFAELHGEPFNFNGWMYILNKHNGYLPVRIKALPEGTVVPTRNAIMTVENTDPNVPWLTSYLETMLLRLWYPMTVATRIYYMKQKIIPFFEQTSDIEVTDFALLDFSSRGCTSLEANELGGYGYLMNFMGSDSVPAVRWTNHHYHSEMSGFSVPATEHSIMCAYGQDNELESFKRLLATVNDNGILSVVSDTWNIFEACEKWVTLKDEIIRRNITLVVRPDSGEIEDVLPRVLDILRNGFGATKNSKGYDVLNNVKVLWGDGINEDTVVVPFQIAKMLKISADSIITGSGGGLMQANIDRDTAKFAFKASNITIDGVDNAIAKNPITDPGKQSKKGRMKVAYSPAYDSRWKTITVETHGQHTYDVTDDQLRVVYENGEMFNVENLDRIRDRLNSQ